MSYSEQLRDRVREILYGQKKVVEKKMFGGITFMVNGKMCVGVLKDEIMARIDPAVYEKALKRKGCREMRFTGKPMKGFVFIGTEGTKSKKDLEYWVGLAMEFNEIAKASKKKL
jgi:TfoX/Sxy family transcriptional regulator of competence genes